VANTSFIPTYLSFEHLVKIKLTVSNLTFFGTYGGGERGAHGVGGET
jgi:hypothetical protein